MSWLEFLQKDVIHNVRKYIFGDGLHDLDVFHDLDHILRMESFPIIPSCHLRRMKTI